MYELQQARGSLHKLSKKCNKRAKNEKVFFLYYFSFSNLELTVFAKRDKCPPFLKSSIHLLCALFCITKFWAQEMTFQWFYHSKVDSEMGLWKITVGIKL